MLSMASSNQWSTVAWMSGSEAAAWWATITYGRMSAHWSNFRASHVLMCSRSPDSTTHVRGGESARVSSSLVSAISERTRSAFEGKCRQNVARVVPAALAMWSMVVGA
ncbi:MAG: hypothetical protein ACOC84_01085 [Actinomycetota bacterium]